MNFGALIAIGFVSTLFQSASAHPREEGLFSAEALAPVSLQFTPPLLDRVSGKKLLREIAVFQRSHNQIPPRYLSPTDLRTARNVLDDVLFPPVTPVFAFPKIVPVYDGSRYQWLADLSNDPVAFEQVFQDWLKRLPPERLKWVVENYLQRVFKPARMDAQIASRFQEVFRQITRLYRSMDALAGIDFDWNNPVETTAAILKTYGFSYRKSDLIDKVRREQNGDEDDRAQGYDPELNVYVSWEVSVVPVVIQSLSKVWVAYQLKSDPLLGDRIAEQIYQFQENQKSVYERADETARNQLVQMALSHWENLSWIQWHQKRRLKQKLLHMVRSDFKDRYRPGAVPRVKLILRQVASSDFTNKVSEIIQESPLPLAVAIARHVMGNPAKPLPQERLAGQEEVFRHLLGIETELWHSHDLHKGASRPSTNAATFIPDPREIGIFPGHAGHRLAKTGS